MKPVLYYITAWDKSYPKLITFSYGGGQISANRLSIYNNTTNALVYQQTQTTLRNEHTIPANTLSNNVLYYATVSVTSGGVQSPESDPMLFRCVATPTFSVNIANNGTVTSSTFDVIITYSQVNNETLQSYKVILYDASKNILYDSGLKYNTTSPQVTLSGMLDNTSYYVKAFYSTLNGLTGETDYIKFTCDYIISKDYLVCDVTNNFDDGTILIKSNISAIEGYANGEVQYINGTYADLTNLTVTFDKDYSISGDFKFSIKGVFLTNFCYVFSDSSRIADSIKLYLRSEDSTTQYFEMITTSYGLSYMIQSVKFPKQVGLNDITVWLKRVNNLYELEVL